MCHAIEGTRRARAAPDLTHLASRATLAAGTLPNTRRRARALDRRSAALQAGRQHAARPLRRRTCASPRISGRCNDARERINSDEVGLATTRSQARSKRRRGICATARRRIAAAAELERTWSDPPGFIGWLCADRPQGDRPALHRHRVRASSSRPACSRRLMRLQLARPNNPLIGPDLYNQLFTMHGTTMMFLFAVPVMQAIRGLPRAADGRHAQRRVPAHERIRLLDLPVRRPDAVRRFAAQHRPRRRLVRLRAARRARLRRSASASTSGTAGHLHRGDRA